VNKRAVAALAVAVLAVSLLAGYIYGEPSTQNQPSALQTIIIHPDGSISPANIPIKQNGNVYTFTDNIYGAIKIQKSNIILDGAGYTLSGPYNGSQTDVWVVGDGPDQNPGSIAQWVIGIDFSGKNVQGITIQNINVCNFSIGMYVWTKNNTIIGSAILDNTVGLLLSGMNNTVTKDYIAGNKQGLFMGFDNEGNTSIPADIIINSNDFENNGVQLNGCKCKDLNSTEPPHNWDNGQVGNFWSDYNGTDLNGDGVGDTPYKIDALNLDRYPLMNSLIQPPPPFPKPNAVFIVISTVLAGAVLALVTFLEAWFLRKRRR
jgi:hypothetical protein